MITVLKRRFEAAPNKDEILNLLVGEIGDKGKAKDALLQILAPMKDLLAVLAFTETLEAAAGQYAEMLKEQEATAKAIESMKTQTTGAKKAADAAIKKLADLEVKILELETRRDAVAAEVVTETEAKLRASQAVADEYDKLRQEMQAKVAAEEQEARKGLEEIQAKTAAAQAELDTLAEKKRQFIASLTA